ncbi:MAG: hypothetical protein ABEJ95_06005 [Candidatus Nanohalobium sp.]
MERTEDSEELGELVEKALEEKYRDQNIEEDRIQAEREKKTTFLEDNLQKIIDKYREKSGEQGGNWISVRYLLGSENESENRTVGRALTTLHEISQVYEKLEVDVWNSKSSRNKYNIKLVEQLEEFQEKYL